MASDDPNLTPTKKVNGKTVESNPPKAPAGTNSSIRYQGAGSSIAKQAQGVLANTMTELNNLIPAAGCPIRLPNDMEKLKTKLQLYIQTESQRLVEWAEKLTDFINPLVEDIKQAVKSIKKMIKQIQDYIKEIMEVVQFIQKLIQDIMAFIQFIMSLPERLMKLLINCMQALMDGAKKFVTDSFSTPPNTSSTTVPMNATTGTYTKAPTSPNSTTSK